MAKKWEDKKLGYAVVAQLVERETENLCEAVRLRPSPLCFLGRADMHRSFKPRDAGSTPVGSTCKSTNVSLVSQMFFEHLTKLNLM